MSGIIQCQVYQAITRPKSWLGADYYHAVLSVIVSGIMFIQLENPFLLLAFFPLQFIGIIMFRFDPYFYPILKTVGQTRFKALKTSRTWNGNISFSPNISRWSKKKKNDNK